MQKIVIKPCISGDYSFSIWGFKTSAKDEETRKKMNATKGDSDKSQETMLKFIRSDKKIEYDKLRATLEPFNYTKLTLVNGLSALLISIIGGFATWISGIPLVGLGMGILSLWGLWSAWTNFKIWFEILVHVPDKEN